MEHVCNVALYPDSDATNHFTHDQGNVQQFRSYGGNKFIFVSNGDLMRITHSCHSDFIDDVSQLYIEQCVDCALIIKEPFISLPLLFG